MVRGEKVIFLTFSADPILDLEAGDAAEFADVVGDEDRAEAESVGADLGIQWTDGSSGFLQPGPDPAVGFHGRRVEIGDFQGQQKIIQGGGVALDGRCV